MYKKILMAASIIAGLTSCNGDYTDWTMPAENAQQESKTTVLYATANTDLIDLETVTADSVQLFTFEEMPTVEYYDAWYEITPSNYRIYLDKQGRVSSKDLKQAIADVFGRKREVCTFSGKVYAIAKTVATNVQAATTLNLTASNRASEGTDVFQIKAEYPDQPTYYFFTGNANNWTSQATTPFFPSMENKNIQTLTTCYWSAWDGKFWEQSKVGNWDAAYVADVNENRTGSGKITTGQDVCFFAPAEGFYTMTINMDDMTYTFTECEDQFPAEYNTIGIVGLNDDWDNDVILTQVLAGGKGDAPSHIWYAYNVAVDHCSWGCKFRVDRGWDISWGNSNSDFPYGIANTGDNIGGVAPGTYDVYFNDITKQYLFIAK